MTAQTAAPVLRLARSPARAFRLLRQDLLGWVDKAAAQGPLVGLGLGPLRLWVLTDHEAVRRLLISDREAWQRSPLLMNPVRLVSGEHLFSQPDDAWSQIQPALAPSFRTRALEPRLRELPALIDGQVGALPAGTTIDIDRVLQRLTVVVAAWVLFGALLDPDRADELVDHQRAAIDWLGRQLTSPAGTLPFAVGPGARRMRRHRDALNAYAGELIEARRRAGEGAAPDVLDALLVARPGGRPLSEEQLRSHIIGLLVAGNETTASALSWAVVEGAANPQEWAALRRDPARAAAYVDETLRLHPPAWATDRSPVAKRARLTVGGLSVDIPRREAVMLYLRGLHRDPAVWPEPDAFRPDRHLDPSRAQERTLIPFGLGARGCIGQHLALAEMAAVLPALASKGDVDVGETSPDPAFTLRVAGGLRGRITPASDLTPS